MDGARISIEEDKRLLSDDLTDRHSEESQSVRPRKKRFDCIPVATLSALLLFFALYSVALVSFIKRGCSTSSCTQCQPLLYSPANGILTKEEKILDASVLRGNVYKGPPRPELDKAWQELLLDANVRVSGEELAKSGGESIPLGDGSGYYGILDVFHQLHCLKYVRHFVFQDYYNDTMPWTPTHVDHCIDSIRQNLMCNADLSLMTFHWVDDDMAPKPLFRRTHECANWDKIQDWASKRSFNPDDPKLLLHPKLAKN